MQPRGHSLLSCLLRVLCLALGAGILAGEVAAQSLTVTTWVGQRTIAPASVDGTGTNARFSYIPAMVADAAGNIFVSDANNFTIRKVTPAGVVTTFAGLAGSSGYVDATGANARFRQPGAMARDAAGNLYVGDGTRVRKISPAGAVTTLVAQPGLVGAASSGTTGNAFNGDAVWGFNLVTALVVDAGNNLLVGDFSAIRKIGNDSRESVLAGARFAQGAADGPGADARFGIISGLALDTNGNLFASDTINHNVRKITSAGVVSTVAGLAGSGGFADGRGATARFDAPAGLAFDGAGGLVIADGNNHGLRRLSPTGIVTTIAGGPGLPVVIGPDGFSVFGDGVGSLARFGGPSAVTVDAAGTVFVADGGTIRKGANVAVAAKIIVAPTAQTSPAGQRATFSVVANGNPAVTYRWQRQIAASAPWADVADGGSFAGATTAALVVSNISLAMDKHQFRCVATNSLGGDTSAAAALAVDPPVIVVPLRVATLAGKAGTNAGGADGAGGAARFTFPQALALDGAGNLYVVDSMANRIRKTTAAGVVSTVAGTGSSGSADGPATAAQFNMPGGIAVDSVGVVYVADSANCTIRKITPAGVVTTLAGQAGQRGFANGTGGAARFSAPVSMVLDPTGLLVVADSLNGVLRKITPTGIVTTIDYHFPDPTDPNLPLSTPQGLAVDAANNLYVADSGNHTVRKITPAGNVTTLGGKAGVAGSMDGRALNARFNSPTAVALDAAGNVYVADTGNHTIRKISAAGLVSTVAGLAPSAANANSSGSADGIGAVARFNQPRGLVIDRSGTLFIADSLNNTLRKATATDAVSTGDPVVFSVLTVGDSQPVTYQWRKNSVAIAGATSELFSIPTASASDAGEYSVEVSTDGGGVVSAAVKLAIGPIGEPVVTPPVQPPVTPPTPVSRIVNLSIRSTAGQGAATLAVGFVVNGRLPLLVRGIGPSLAQFGVGSALADPRLAVYAGSALAASNDNWANTSELRDAVARLGAFALADGSLDAALLAAMEPGAFTAQCTGANNATGIALVELYDAGTTGSGRLVNVSARSQVGAGEGVLIAGFSISGTAPRSLLIRGVGPALAEFGVAGVLADPQLRLVDEKGALQAQNDNWADNAAGAQVSIAAQAVGAFPLSAGSKDAALVVALAPGTYSVQLGGTAGSTGVGLVEIYEIP